MANLYTLIKADEKQVRKICTKELRANGYNPVITDDFIYAEGTIPVLFVAHYDTVLKKKVRYIHNYDGILSAEGGLGADDRAGVYAILELIKKHHVHVLFTGGEEIGCVGAEAFTQSDILPKVNYIIELDRRGSNDAVYYEGTNEEFEKYITSKGWVTAMGSFTDICVLAPYVDCAAVNLSIGYNEEHKATETLDTKIMNDNIARLPELLDGPHFDWESIDWFEDEWDLYDMGYGRRGKYSDTLWIIAYEEDGASDVDYVAADSYAEAVGEFLMHYPNLTFNDIHMVEPRSTMYN